MSNGEFSMSQEKAALVDRLVTVLNERFGGQTGDPSFADKKRVLEALPDDFFYQIKADLYQKAVEDKKRNGSTTSRSEKDPDLWDRGHISGRLFELLVETEMREKMRQSPEKLGLLPLAEEILSVAQNPDVRGLGGELGHFRNPDLAYVEMTKSGRVVLMAAGEAKLGELDQRAFYQLSGGFREGIKHLISCLNKLDDYLERGLYQLHKLKEERIASLKLHGQRLEEAGRATILKISPGFKQILFVPADRKHTTEADLDALIKPPGGGSVTELQRGEFRNLLSQTEIVNSVFDRREIAEMTTLIKESIGTKKPEVVAESAMGSN